MVLRINQTSSVPLKNESFCDDSKIWNSILSIITDTLPKETLSSTVGSTNTGRTSAGIPADTLVQAVINQYPPGAPIGWHRDVPQFEVIVGISLGASCRMRLKPYKAEGSIIAVVLEPRSIYRICGVARWRFQHSIPAVEALRYSITFRTLRVSSKEKKAA